MMRHIHILLIVLAGVVAGCAVETAQPLPIKRLVIVSDFLGEEDSLLFDQFSLETGIDVEVYLLSTSQIQKKLLNEGANSGIDLLLLKSSYHTFQLSKQNALQISNYDEFIRAHTNKFSSAKYGFVGIGINPYIIAAGRNNPIRTYNDLTVHPHINLLQEKSAYPLLAPIIRKKDKVAANKWIKAYVQQGIFSPNDSLMNTLPWLMQYSDFTSSTIADSILQSRSILYPNQSSTGCFYDLVTFSIARQAENYAEAIKCVEFFLDKKNNSVLNKALSTRSIFEIDGAVRLYNSKIEDLAPYYELVRRTIEKVDS